MTGSTHIQRGWLVSLFECMFFVFIVGGRWLVFLDWFKYPYPFVYVGLEVGGGCFCIWVFKFFIKYFW